MAFIPVGTTTQATGQNHLATVYYNRVGLDQLVPKFRFYAIADKFQLPQSMGKTMQMWRDNVPGYNTVPAAEGTIGTPFVNGSATLTATVEQYSDFMSTSRMMQDTSIVDENARMVRALSIRAAGTIDTIIHTEIDSNSSRIVTTVGSTLATADFKQRATLLEGVNVEPFDGVRFMAVIHPYLKYDLISDNTAGGFIDSLKYTNGVKVLNGELGEVGGTRILLSTNVGDDGVAATSTKYYCYIHGNQGVGVVELEGRNPEGIVDPKRQNYSVKVFNSEGGIYDPTGEVASTAGYRFVFVAKTLDANRFWIVKADSSIA